MSKRTRTLLLVAALLLAVFALSGCGTSTESFDPSQPPSTGIWAMIVWGIAWVLYELNMILASVGIRYSWGWAIIVFTVFIKLVTLPLTRQQLKSTKATQELQPKLKELQQKYGKDRQKLSEEQMKLYKEAGVNPMGGCLPMLVQLPILWGLYQALYELARPGPYSLQGARFYWIPDLAFPSLAVGTKWIGESFAARDWATLAAYFSLPIIMLASQMVLQRMTQPAKAQKGAGTDSQSQMMGQMMMFMPIMFGYITLGLPSGLTLYWTVSNILSLVQQYFVTGWGGLVDWIPALKPKPAEVVMAPDPSFMVEAGPEKPVKRRRRRR